MSYMRVIPRDLFNEADLLKMLGRLTIVIDESPKLRREWKVLHNNKAFKVEQDENDGSIYCKNVIFVYKGNPVHLFRPLNARLKWRLYGVCGDDFFEVFDEKGNYIMRRTD